MTYLDRKGNPTGRSVRGFRAFPVRYDVINVDSRSGSPVLKEVLELVVEHYEYDGGTDDKDDNQTQKGTQGSELLSKGYSQAVTRATPPKELTQVSKFRLDIVSGEEKAPTGSWWSIIGGDCVIEVIETTEGEDQPEQKRPGQAYFGDITIRGPFCKDRKAVMDWVNNMAKGKRDRKDLTLEFLDNRDQVVMTFILKECLPVSYSPPAVSAGNYEMLEETLSFLVVQIEQN